MNDVLAAAVELQTFIQAREWSFCIIGGIALARWGQPRATADADATLLTGFGNEEFFIDILLAEFNARTTNPKEFALQNRVLLLRSSQGIGLDVALGGLPFEENLVSRATDYDFGMNAHLLTASAEDMVVLKSFAGRSQDWTDVEGIIIRQSEKLNWDLVLKELQPLCQLKESPETVERLLALRDKLTE